MANLSIAQEQTHHKVISSSFSLKLAHIIADPATKLYFNSYVQNLNKPFWSEGALLSVTRQEDLWVSVL